MKYVLNTVDTETLIKRIRQRTTLTIHNLKGAISALSQEITHHLKEGRKVNMEWLGYFSPSIDGEVVTDKNDKLNLKNPRVHTVKFLSEEQMRQLSFSCQGHKDRHSQPQSETSIDESSNCWQRNQSLLPEISSKLPTSLLLRVIVSSKNE